MYFAFLGAMAYCCFVGYTKGDLAKIIAPIDRNGNFCGVNHEDKDGNKVGAQFEAYPFLYFPQFHSGDGGAESFRGIHKTSFCVKDCPSADNAEV